MKNRTTQIISTGIFPPARTTLPIPIVEVSSQIRLLTALFGSGIPVAYSFGCRRGTPYGNNGYSASQYAFFSVPEDKLAVSYFLDHVYRFNVGVWLRPNLNEPGIFGLGARNQDPL
jgi:hypothetical protein